MESRSTDGRIFGNHFPDNGIDFGRVMCHLSYKNNVNNASEVDSDIESDDEDDGPPPLMDTPDSDIDSDDDDDFVGVTRRITRFQDSNNVAGVVNDE